ncbi:tellurite resistance TerB family protein, partial [Vibrio parahaemolyticus]|nr:tellurite resistance TerB family protein [Vibrio parahaemolyticus]
QASTPQQASEIYLASLIVAEEQNFMEKAYLQELAKQLQLSPAVTYQLEAQMQ